MAREIINSDSQRPFGPTNGGIGTEFGDTWDVAVNKINRMFDEIYTVGTAVLNYTPPLQLSGNTLSIAPGGVTNGLLANPGLTLGTTSLQLGGTYSAINGNLTFGGTVNFTGSVEIGGTPLSLPLTVSQGGTGQTSFTGNALLYGNGTSGFGQVPVNGGTNKFLTQANGFAPSFNAIQTGDLPALPAPTTSALGGIKAVNAVSHQWLSSIDTTGTPHLTQPAFGDLSGNIAIGQMNGGSGASTSTFWRGDGTWATVLAGVTSVSNSDGSLSFSPATGAVVGSLNTAHANTWTVAQTFYAANGWGYIAPGVNGVAGNGTTDDAAAIQAILNAYQYVFWSAGVYLIKSTLTISCQNASVIIRGAGAQLELGNGTFILAGSTFSGSAAVEIFSTAGNEAGYSIGGFSVTCQTAGAGPSIGTFVASPGGDNRNCIHDVICSGFAVNWSVENSNSIQWLRCSGWNLDRSGTPTSHETDFQLYATGGAFCGDMEFIGCITRSSATGIGVNLTDLGHPSASVAGLKFIGCELFGALNTFWVNPTGTASGVGDIWFIGSQFNGPGSTNFVLIQTGAANQLLQDYHFEGTYFTEAFAGIQALCTAGGEVASITISGCFFDGFSNKAVFVDGAGAADVKVVNNTFKGVSNPGSQAVLFNNGKGHTFMGNVMYNNSTGSNNVNYMLSIGSSASYVIATNNQGCGAPSVGIVQNLSTSFVIDNNNQ